MLAASFFICTSPLLLPKSSYLSVLLLMTLRPSGLLPVTPHSK